MGSPEKPVDVEMADMSETDKLQPGVEVKGGDGKGDEDRFTGLKKDELLELSSQTKWVVTRWVLFVIFWLAWVGMLVGAIVIVVKAPRCKEEPTPPWYQDTVVYQADVTKFAESFTGMAEHVDYVRSLNSKTLTVCHANDPQDLSKPRDDDLAKLLEAAHNEEKEKNIMVVVNLRIDATSTSSPEFKSSATKTCADSSSGGNCTLFRWLANDSVPAGETDWMYHAGRGQNYKSAGDDLAYLDYGGEQAIAYLKNLAKTWIGYGIDGFQLQDMSMVGDQAQQMNVVKVVQEAINETQEAIPEVDKRKVIGLFLLSSNIDAQSSLLPDPDVNNDTDSAATVVNTALSKATTAQEIESAIMKWRNATEPFIPAYAVNTMDMDLLAKRLGKEKAAGLGLLNFALPGVPVLRSGDEALLNEDNITWVDPEQGTHGQVPFNSSNDNLELIREVSALRVNQHRALRSLRWDNEDAKFGFRNTNTSEVVAFTRKWDQKPTILTIYNPSDKDVYVEVDKAENEKSLKVLLVSEQSVKDSSYTFDSVKMMSGLTVMFEIA